MCVTFTQHPGETGWVVIGGLRPSYILNVYISLRMGIAYSLAAIGTLVGTPIIGALLTAEYHWTRGIIFSTVSHFCSSKRSCLIS